MRTVLIILVVACTLLLAGSVPLIVLGSLTIDSVVKFDAVEFRSHDGLSPAELASQVAAEQLLTTQRNMAEQVGIGELVAGFLALGGGVACAVFARKQ